jgi:hypothetical protein
MIKKQGRPVTGATPAMQSRPPVRSSVNTSTDTERTIMRPENQFSNPYGVVKTPAPTSNYVNTRRSKSNVYYDGGSPVDPNQKAGGYAVTHVGCANTQDTNYAATNDRKPRGYNSIMSGFPLGAPRKVGGGNQPSAKRGKR